MTGIVQNSSKGKGQGGGVGQRIQIGGAFSVSDPKALLSRKLKAGVVVFALWMQGISLLELGAFPIVIGDWLVFGVA